MEASENNESMVYEMVLQCILFKQKIKEFSQNSTKVEANLTEILRSTEILLNTYKQTAETNFQVAKKVQSFEKLLENNNSSLKISTKFHCELCNKYLSFDSEVVNAHITSEFHLKNEDRKNREKIQNQLTDSIKDLQLGK